MKRYESMTKEEIIRFLTPHENSLIDADKSSSIIKQKLNILLSDVDNTKAFGINKVVDGYVFGPKHLESILDVSYDSISLNSTQIRFRTMWWLIYLGVRPSDVFSIKKNDVNIDDLYVKYKDTELEICKESLLTIKKCRDLEFFAKKYSNDSGYEFFSDEERVDSDVLLAGIKFRGGKTDGKPSEKHRSITVQAEKYIREAYSKSKKIITTKSVFLSGLFFRMFLKECIGGVSDFTEVATDDFNQTEHTGESLTERRKRDIISRKNKQYLSLYRIWKDLLP